MTKKPVILRVFPQSFSSFELTRYDFALHNQFPEVSLETFHRAWKSSTSFGQQFYILEDAPYSTGSFIDDEDLIWFDLRLCHLIGLFSGEPITSKNTFRDFLNQKFQQIDLPWTFQTSSFFTWILLFMVRSKSEIDFSVSERSQWSLRKNEWRRTIIRNEW